MKQVKNIFGCLALLGVASCSTGEDTAAYFNGDTLYADVEHYIDHGTHRTGTAGDSLTSEWLGEELRTAGYDVKFLTFPLHQFFPEEVSVTVEGNKYEAFPYWYVGEKLIGDVTAPLQVYDSLQSVKEKVVLLEFKWGDQGKLNETKSQLIQRLATSGAKGVIAFTNYTQDALVAFNAEEDRTPWPIPVVVVSSQTGQHLSTQANADVTISIAGELKDITARNVYGTIGHGEKHVVISTPISGWFTSGGERGPGIAIWLALAKWVATADLPYTFVFTANSGHELSGIGAKKFLNEGAPAPDDTHLWLHLGAGIATKAWNKNTDGHITWKDEVDSARNFFYSENLKDAFDKTIGLQPGNHYNIKQKAGGELIYVIDKGYPRVSGVAYAHPYFHLDSDDASTTSPQLLENLAQAYRDFITLATNE